MTFISTQSNSLTRTAVNSVQSHGRSLNKSIEKLSTGKRLNRAGDDVASMSIATKIDKDIRGIDQAQRNVMDAIGHMEVAEGGLLKSLENVQRVRELMVQGLNGTNSVEEKNMLQREINEIVRAQQFLADETRLNMYIPTDAVTVPFDQYDVIFSNNFARDLSLSTSTRGIDYQLGPNQENLVNVDFRDYSQGQLSVNPGQFYLNGPNLFQTGNLENRFRNHKIPGATVEPIAGDGVPPETDTLQDLDNAVNNISAYLSIVNGVKTKFQEQFNYLDEKKMALEGSLSHFQDTDFAQETAEFTKSQIRQQTASAMLSQSNAQSQLALSLLP